MAKKKDFTARYEKRTFKGKQTKVLIIRDAKGKFVTSKKAIDIKKSFQNKKKALEHFKQTASLKKEVTRVNTFQNTKNKIVYSTKRTGTVKRSQIMCKIPITKYGKTQTYIGYSDLGNIGQAGREQALNRALQGAKDKGIITYDKYPLARLDSQIEYSYISYDKIKKDREIVV